jgi:hypothetical protein
MARSSIAKRAASAARALSRNGLARPVDRAAQRMGEGQESEGAGVTREAEKNWAAYLKVAVAQASAANVTALRGKKR